MVDIEPISFYLGVKVKQNKEKLTIKLSQSVYIDKVFSKFYLDKAYTINTSIKKIALLK